MMSLSPLLCAVCAAGVIENRHVAAACSTRARSLLMTISPARVLAAGFSGTLNVTSPLPWPAAGEMPVIQAVWDAAVHAHSGCVLTASVAVAPEALMVAGADNVTAHFTGEGPAVTLVLELHAVAIPASTTTNARRDDRTGGKRRGQRIDTLRGALRS
jgi:hypothetical protein